ncbi:YfbU family protein [Bradyrhizobium sp. 2]|uniref:YfbU family protein n=1 Tax=Bradyrhizobium sp. 2 TaxID=190045 RepID=UPI001FFAA9B8|nr:YfbU family protein [Bradyrhizobium sp. 2]MCK1459604.1 YfbU family protein [Bradyrhizobium sp. 2]
MKLSDGEKLTILMLCDIYKALKIKGEFDPEFISTTIFKDHLWGFNWELSGIPFEKGDDPPEVGETCDFLDMWKFIETGYEKLTPAEKKQLAKDADPFGNHVKFPGFDGNHEPHYGIASYMIRDMQHRFEYFKGRDLNSHSSSVSSYKRMYKIFETMRAGLNMRELNLAELTTILNAQRYPG